MLVLARRGPNSRGKNWNEIHERSRESWALGAECVYFFTCIDTDVLTLVLPIATIGSTNFTNERIPRITKLRGIYMKRSILTLSAVIFAFSGLAHAATQTIDLAPKDATALYQALIGTKETLVCGLTLKSARVHCESTFTRIACLSESQVTCTIADLSGTETAATTITDVESDFESKDQGATKLYHALAAVPETHEMVGRVSRTTLDAEVHCQLNPFVDEPTERGNCSLVVQN